jgi:hypothetical protein
VGREVVNATEMGMPSLIIIYIDISTPNINFTYWE